MYMTTDDNENILQGIAIGKRCKYQNQSTINWKVMLNGDLLLFFQWHQKHFMKEQKSQLWKLKQQPLSRRRHVHSFKSPIRHWADAFPVGGWGGRGIWGGNKNWCGVAQCIMSSIHQGGQKSNWKGKSRKRHLVNNIKVSIDTGIHHRTRVVYYTHQAVWLHILDILTFPVPSNILREE